MSISESSFGTDGPMLALVSLPTGSGVGNHKPLSTRTPSSFEPTGGDWLSGEPRNAALARKRIHESRKQPEDPTRTAMQLLELVLDQSTVRSPAERSNTFATWKKALVNLSTSALHSSVEYRQVLGAMLVVTNDRDLEDCTESMLEILREGMRALHAPRTAEIDVRRLRRALDAIGEEIALPLSPDDLSEAQIAALDAEIDAILEAHQAE